MLNAGLKGKSAHNGNKVRHPVTHLGQYELVLRVEALTLSHVVENYKDVAIVVVWMNQAPSIDQEGALTDAWEVVLDLISDYRSGFRND